MEEENSFWIMVTIVEDLLPASYYSSTLLGKFLLNLIMSLNIYFTKFRDTGRSESIAKPDFELFT